MNDDIKKALLEDLHNGPIFLFFEKTNGTIRKMCCTLASEMLPEKPVLKEGDPEPVKKTPNPEVQAIWDLEEGSWRSFRWDSVIIWSANGVYKSGGNQK